VILSDELLRHLSGNSSEAGFRLFKELWGQLCEDLLRLEPGLRSEANRLSRIVPRGQAYTHWMVLEAGYRIMEESGNPLSRSALAFLVEQEQRQESPNPLRTPLDGAQGLVVDSLQ